MNRKILSLVRSSIFLFLTLTLLSAYALNPVNEPDMPHLSDLLHRFGLRINQVLAATAEPDPNYSTDEDISISKLAADGLLVNDSINGPTTVTIDDSLTIGLVNKDGDDGAFTYDPDDKFEYLTTSGSTTDSFAYTVTDNDGISAPATVTITIHGVNDQPTISDISDQSTSEETATAPIPFTIGDAETSAESLTVTASSGNTDLVPDANIVIDGTGANQTVTITPAANQSGSALITVTVTDENSGSTNDTFTLTVEDLNELPTITDIPNQSTDEDTPTDLIPFTIGDVETPVGELDVAASSDNTILVPNTNILFDGTGTERTVTITPALNQFGSALITITVTDGDNEVANDTFTLTVNAVNDDPTISDIPNQTTDEDVQIGPIDFEVNDIETPVASLDIAVSSGNPTLVPNGNIAVGGSGSNRTLTITPAGNQSGSAVITVTVTDTNGGSDSDTFTLTVNAVNDAPTIQDITDKTTSEDTPIGPISFTIGDAETPVDNLSVTASSSNTGLVPNANILLGGGGASRTITITPALNQNTSTVITVTVTDANDVSTEDTFTLNVTAVNDAPTITSIANWFIDEDTETDPIPFTVGDVETPAGSLLVTASSSNTTLVPIANIDHGGTGGSRNVTITPVDDQYGTTDITITVNDLTGGIASDTFTLTVDPAEDPPVITQVDPVDVDMDEDGFPKAFDLTLNATDPDGDFLTWSISEPAGHGTATAFGVGASKEIGYTPDTNYNGTDSFVVQVSDGTGNSDTITVNVNIAPVNDAPTGLPDPYEVNYGTTLTVPAPGVLGNDSDPDEGDTITAVKITDPSHGTLNLNTNGSFSYTPVGSFIGEDTFTYQVKDLAGLTSAAVQVVINVKDASSPSLVWVEPVGDGGQRDVFGEVITLKVNATDDVSVDYVRFYRWDPNVQPNGAFIDIDIDEEPPFEIPINTSILNYEFNEIRATAYDNTGKFSSQKWIWLFRVPPTNYLFIPLAAGK